MPQKVGRNEPRATGSAEPRARDRGVTLSREEEQIAGRWVGWEPERVGGEKRIGFPRG